MNANCVFLCSCWKAKASEENFVTNTRTIHVINQSLNINTWQWKNWAKNKTKKNIFKKKWQSSTIINTLYHFKHKQLQTDKIKHEKKCYIYISITLSIDDNHTYMNQLLECNLYD